MMPDLVYGWWIITDDNGSEVHRVAGHAKPGSPSHERAEYGLMRRVDLERFTVGWTDAR